MGANLDPFSFPPSLFPFPSLVLSLFCLFPTIFPLSPLEVKPQIQLGRVGERSELPSGVWERAPAEIVFGALCL